MEVKEIIFSAVISLIAAVSCIKGSSNDCPEDVQPVEFTASVVSDTPTKTFLSGTKINWELSDEVSVFNGTTANSRYGVKPGTEGNTPVTLVSKQAFANQGASLSSNLAYYPYSENVAASEDGQGLAITAKIPAVQSYAKDSYDRCSFPMCAATSEITDYDLKFYNILGILKFRFMGEDLKVTRITVRGNNKEILAGEARISVSDSPQITFTGTGETTVELDCGTGVELAGDSVTDFYISLPPQTFSNGITVTVYTADKAIEKKTTVPLTISRSSITPMDPLVPYIYVSSVSLDRTSAVIERGTELQLVATVSPENATEQDVTWSSSDASIAAVSETGKVSAISPGMATIKVTSVDGSKTASCKISVIVGVTGIDLEPAAEIYIGRYHKLTVSVYPDDATDKSLEWSTSDKSVAVVEDGTVTAVKEGTATITARSAQSGVSATCHVTVINRPVESVSLGESTLSLISGDTYTIPVTIYPQDATNSSVTWSSSNTTIASVDAYGKITAGIPGSAVITVKTVDGGFFDTCDVTVLPRKVESVSLNKTVLEIKEFASETLIATVNPSGATDSSVSWSSSDPSVATVSSSGKVTAVEEGTCLITVTTNDGGKTATCSVTVIGVNSIGEGGNIITPKN